jgi:hypothetical protein
MRTKFWIVGLTATAPTTTTTVTPITTGTTRRTNDMIRLA